MIEKVISKEEFIRISEEEKIAKKTRFESLISEIERSDPRVLSASDFQYYASELNECQEEKEYTANQVRIMMMESKGVNIYDMLDTFIDDETDDIIDFY